MNEKEQARILNIRGRSKMTTEELKKAIKKCLNKLNKDKIYVKTCKNM